MPSKQWQRCVLRFGSEKDIFDEFDTDFTGKLLGMNSYIGTDRCGVQCTLT